MLNLDEARHRARFLLASLGPLPAVEALQVLNAAVAHVLNLAQAEDRERLSAPVGVPVFRSARRRGRVSTVESDSEVLAFVHALPAHYTYQQIADACRERFGDRAPSRSALHRYGQKLKYPNGRRNAPSSGGTTG